MKPRTIILALALIAVVIMSLIFLRPSPITEQLKRLKLAEKHLEIVGPKIAADTRFSKVSLIVYTGRGGCLRIDGTVKTPEDEEELKQFMDSTKPPVEVLYFVSIEKPES